MKATATCSAPAADLAGLRQRLLKTACQHVRNLADAEDLVQRAFVRYLESRPGLRAYTDPAAWMSTVIKHLAIDDARHRQVCIRQRYNVEEGLERIPYVPVAWEHVGEKQVWRAARSCSARLQTAFEMFYIEGLSLREIGERCQISLNSAGTRVHRARNRIRKVLQPLMLSRPENDTGDLRRTRSVSDGESLRRGPELYAQSRRCG